MNAALIRPFVSSIQNVFSTMLQLPVAVRDPHVRRRGDTQPACAVSIELRGDVAGDVVLRIPHDTAGRIVALFCGEYVEENSPMFIDAVGELTNMVTGGAKAGFQPGWRVALTCPRFEPNSEAMERPGAVVIPCVSDCGDFSFEVAVTGPSCPERGAA